MELTGSIWASSNGRLSARRLVAFVLSVWLVCAAWQLRASAEVGTTTVQGTVYLANGQPGSGLLHVSWPAFTTANGQAVVADSLDVPIGQDGFLTLNLAPNQGAMPGGLFYTAVFYMDDGSASTQYWVVPASAQATLAQIQAQVMPAAQAVQAVNKAYVDDAIAQLSQSSLTGSGGTLTGPLFLSGDPTQPLQAADKHYVDSAIILAGVGGGSSVNAASPGQIAFYAADGKSLSGTSAVPVGTGGTGATTADGALQNLGGLSGTRSAAQSMSGPLNLSAPYDSNTTNLNQAATAQNVRDVAPLSVKEFAGADLGAQIDAAYASTLCPSGGCNLHVPLGNYSLSTPVVFGTPYKPAKLECDAGTTLTYTGTGGSMFTFNSGSDVRGWGITGCTIVGPGAGTSTTGVTLGGSNNAGADGFEITGSTISGFGTSLQFASNAWLTHISRSSIQNSGKLVYLPSGLTDAGENLVFDHVAFVNNGAATAYFSKAVDIEGESADTQFLSCSFDSAQLYVANGKTHVEHSHFENPGPTNLGDYYVSNSAEMTIKDSVFLQDATSGTMPPGFVSNTGNGSMSTGGNLFATPGGTTIAYAYNSAGVSFTNSGDLAYSYPGGGTITTPVNMVANFAYALNPDSTAHNFWVALGSKTAGDIYEAYQGGTNWNGDYIHANLGNGATWNGNFFNFYKNGVLQASLDSAGNMGTNSLAVGNAISVGTNSDPCAVATTALAAGKTVIDLSGIASHTCASTLTINASAKIIWGVGTYTLNGNPGINVTAANATIEGKGSSHPYGTLLGTTLQSGGAYPLIENNTSGADNMHVQDVTLNGNGVGTFGVLAPMGAGNQYTNVTISGFKYQGLLNSQGVGKLDSVWSNHNGEGGLIASDTNVYGQTQFELNTPGNGLHVIGGGGMTQCQSCDANGFWGIYLDGRTWGDWSPSTGYTQYQIIIPTTNNPGGYAFESTVAASSSGSRPIFPQTVGATVTDGSQTWANIGVEVAANTVNLSHLNGIYADNNGQTGSGGDVIVDGGSAFNANFIYLSSIHTAQQNSPTKAVYGTKIANAGNLTIDGIGYYGSNYSGSGTDLGALYISGSSSVQVNNLTSWYSATTPLYITGSSYNVHVNNASLTLVGSTGTPVASTYCAHIDASYQTILSNIWCGGPTSWAHGIYDAGIGTTISNYKNYTTNAATDDLMNAISVDEDINGTEFRKLNGDEMLTGGNLYMPYNSFLGNTDGKGNNWVNRRYLWSMWDTQDNTCFGVPSGATSGADASVCRMKLGANGQLQWNGGAIISSSNQVMMPCGTATFSNSTTSAALSCPFVTSSSHCVATWIGSNVSGGALGYTASAGSVTLKAASSNSSSASVACSVN